MWYRTLLINALVSCLTAFLLVVLVIPALMPWASASGDVRKVNAFYTGARSHRLILDGGENTTYLHVPEGWRIRDLYVDCESDIPRSIERYSTKGRCIAITGGDMDGDGDPDIVTVSESGYAEVFMNTGSGFVKGLELDLGWGLWDVAMADMDGNGLMDLIFAQKLESKVYVYLNTGTTQVNGTIAPVLSKVSEVETGSYPNSVVCADMNRNGLYDIVTSNENDNTVSVLLNQGGGVLGGRRDYSVPARPLDLTIGDLNGDNYPDIVTTGVDEGVVGVLRNDWGVGFKFQKKMDVGNYPVNVAIHDLNGDGMKDIIAVASSSSSVAVLLNQGQWEFKTSKYGVDPFPEGIDIGDVDGDGSVDIVVTSRDTDSACILRNSQATFQYDRYVVVGDEPRSILVIDVDLDGDLDLISGDSRSGSITVVRNNGDGNFNDFYHYKVGDAPRGMAVGDIDSDGDIDAVTANYMSSGVSVARNDGHGHFQSRHVKSGVEPYSVCIADLNNDGLNDIAMADEARFNISVMLNQNGSFGPYEIYRTGGFPFFITYGDFNGDGALDLVTSNFKNATVSVFINRGHGTYGRGRIYGLRDMAMSLAVDDIDMDGDSDIIAAVMGMPQMPTHYVSILYNDGNGNFDTLPRTDISCGLGPSYVALRDLTGNGYDDMVVANAYDNTVTVLENLDGHNFRTRVEVETGQAPFSVDFIDFDLDGDMDIVTANLNDSSMSLIRNDGDMDFFALRHIAVEYQPYFAYARDFDGDGLDEVLTVNKGVDSIALLPSLTYLKDANLLLKWNTVSMSLGIGHVWESGNLGPMLSHPGHGLVPITVKADRDGIVTLTIVKYTIERANSGVMWGEVWGYVYSPLFASTIAILIGALGVLVWRRKKRCVKRGGIHNGQGDYKKGD